MKAEAQRVAIATACGWHSIRIVPCAGLDPTTWGCPPSLKETSLPTNLVPDYLSDLNACHEMEKVLVDEQRLKFAEYLCDACCTNECCICECVHATALQRCEAFLRTLNLWTDEPPQP